MDERDLLLLISWTPINEAGEFGTCLLHTRTLKERAIKSFLSEESRGSGNEWERERERELASVAHEESSFENFPFNNRLQGCQARKGNNTQW